MLTRCGVVVLVWSVVLAVVMSAGCSRNEFDDRTAVVTVDGRATTFTVDTCGLDATTVFIVGRSSKGDVVQAVVGVEADGQSGVLASTGLTVGPDGAELAAFGAESWQRRGESGAAPGRIDSAQVRGSRIQVSGRLVQTETAAGAAPAPSVAFSFDARCDRKDPAP